MQRYKVIGTILSPVHIGTGKEWDPTRYFINPEQKYLSTYDPDQLLFSLEAAKIDEFYALLEKNNPVHIRSFFSEIARQRPNGHQIDVTDEVAEWYQSRIDSQANQLLINPFIRFGASEEPYIPGSSLKGSVRTAIVSAVAAQNPNLRPPKAFGRESYMFESVVMNYRDAKADPFRALKFSDMYFDQTSTSIISTVVNTNAEGSTREQTGVEMQYEVLKSAISTQTTISFQGEMRLDTDLIRKNQFRNPISVLQMLNSCNQFYNDKMEMEHEKFYQNRPSEPFSERLLKTDVGKDACLVRLGRFSGVESVTLDKFRNPQPPGRHGWGKTRNLAEGVYPMGWVKLTLERQEN